MQRLGTMGLTLLLGLVAGSTPATATSDVDVAPGAPLVEGDVIGVDEL